MVGSTGTCDGGLHIIGWAVFSFSQLDGFDVVYKVLSVPDMMKGMSYSWPEDVNQLLSHPLCDAPLLDTMGLKRLPFLCFWAAHRIWRPFPCWVKPFICVVH